MRNDHKLKTTRRKRQNSTGIYVVLNGGGGGGGGCYRCYGCICNMYCVWGTARCKGLDDDGRKPLRGKEQVGNMGSSSVQTKTSRKSYRRQLNYATG